MKGMQQLPYQQQQANGNGNGGQITAAHVARAKQILKAVGVQVADEGMAEDFFEYATARTAVGATSTASAQIQFQADSAFDVIKTMYFSDIAAGAQTNNNRTIPNILITILDSGSGRQLMNTPIPVYNLFGTAENPFIWPLAKRVAPNSTWTITMQNLEATAYNLALTFAGKKIFYKTGSA